MFAEANQTSTVYLFFRLGPGTAMNEGAAKMLMDGTIIYCNNKFAELLESPEASKGSVFKITVANEYCPLVIVPDIRETAPAGEPSKAEYRH